MPGPNQHFIPRSYLKGFAVRPKRKEAWVYSRDSNPDLKRIKRFAFELNFYSEPTSDGTETLDEEITKYEISLGSNLNTLRSIPVGQPADARIAAETISHLTIRNAHLRETMKDGLRSVLSSVSSVFNDKDRVKPLLGIEGKQANEKFRELFERLVLDDPFLKNSEIPPDVLERIAFTLLRERFDKIFDETAQTINLALLLMAAESDTNARSGHNKALTGSPVPDKRVQALSQLSWRVVGISNNIFIMPDCIALGVENQKSPISLVHCDLDSVVHVLMPLTSSSMLVGSRRDQQFDLTDFNSAAAKSSSQFFVSDQNRDDLNQLRNAIGANLQGHFDDLLKDLDELRSMPTSNPNYSDENPLEAIEANTPHFERHAEEEGSKYSIQFKSVKSEEHAERIAAAIINVVNAVASNLPVYHIDGVTVAPDLSVALEEFDFGYGEPTKEGVSPNVAATNYLVRRNGNTRRHIFITNDTADALLSDNEKEREFATYAVRYQTALTSNHSLLEQAFPALHSSRVKDDYEARLYSYAAGIWSTYFAARVSASTCECMGTTYSDYVRQCLTNAREVTVKAHLAYRNDNDITVLAETALLSAKTILDAVARLLGHLDGIEEGSALDAALYDELKQINLDGWVEALRSELSEIWNNQGSWTSFYVFLSLNRHVERLLWVQGLLPWRMDDGRMWVQIVMQPLSSNDLKEERIHSE